MLISITDKCVDFFKTLEQNVIKRLVIITTLIFFVITYIAFCCPKPPIIAASVSFFGSIFVALKFKLDRASYHKDLFPQRYEIFLVINDILSAWSASSKSTDEMIERISGDLMRRSYFLFGKRTYQFVEKFRQSLIYTKIGLVETDDLEFKEKIKSARYFLGSILSRNNLPDKFPELKIDYY